MPRFSKTWTPEKEKEYMKEYRKTEKFKKRKKEYDKKYCQKNKEHRREISLIYYARNKKECQKRQKEHHHKIKEERVKLLGSRCEKCGYDKSLSALCFHHKNPKTKESKYDVYAKDFNPKDFNLLCLNCHAELHNSNQ